MILRRKTLWVGVVIVFNLAGCLSAPQYSDSLSTRGESVVNAGPSANIHL